MKMQLHKELIEQLTTQFKSYLQSAGHTKRTIQSYFNILGPYLTWLQENKLPYLGINYEQLLGYVKLGRDKGHKGNTINQSLLAIRKFYGMLLKDRPNDKLILATIQALGDLKQRGGTRYLLYDLLSEEQLDSIYNNYPMDNMIQVRNKCIVGMMIYQALRSGDISRIKLIDLDIEKGQVYIAATKSSKERTLVLVANQISPLQKYVLGVRSALLNYSEKGSSKYLFIGKNGTTNLRINLTNLYQQLRQAHPELKHINQLRSSVIRHWLKQDNIRIVQYKLGHRYLSSTQLYLEGDIESLQKQINKLHPLKDD